MKKTKIFIMGLTAVLFILLLKRQEEVSAAVIDGLRLCAERVIPSLFPYMVLSAFLVKSGAVEGISALSAPMMRVFFRLSGSAAPALLLGFTGGYPIGASAAIMLYKNGDISKAEAERLLRFCNCTGPGFVVGYAGAVVFGNIKTGLLLYAVHISSAVICGVLTARSEKSKSVNEYVTGETKASTAVVSSAVTEALTGSVTAVLNVCTYVVVFSVVAALGVPNFLGYVLELTGAVSLAGCSELDCAGKFMLTSGLLAWGGLSVHFQTFALNDCGLDMRWYIPSKLLHTVIAAALAAALSPLAEASTIPAFSVIGVDAYPLLFGTLTIAAIIWMLAICFAQYLLTKYRGWHSRS